MWPTVCGVAKATTPGRQILNNDEDRRFNHLVLVEQKKARYGTYALGFVAGSITLGTAAASAILATGKELLALPFLISVLVCLSQHAYYLRQQRAYRALGDDVHAGYIRHGVMIAKPYEASRTYWAALRSRTVWPVHAAMAVVVLVSGALSL